MLNLMLTQMTANIPDKRPTMSAALEPLLGAFPICKEDPDYRLAFKRKESQMSTDIAPASHDNESV